MENTELEQLKKMVDAYIGNIGRQFSIVENNNKKLNNWIKLRKSVTQNVQQTDDSVLKEMTGYFGDGCLKELIREVADRFINDFENKVTAQSFDIKTIVKSKNI
jgi:hypothetical protein